MSSTATAEQREGQLFTDLPGSLRALENRKYVVVASIWPRALRREESHVRPIRTPDGQIIEAQKTFYEIPASAATLQEAPDNVRTIRVYDTYQVREIPETKRKERLPIFCKDAATGLVNVLTGTKGGASSSRPSMGLIVLSGEEPTDREIQNMLTAQNSYFQQRCLKAEENFRSNQLHLIGDEDRMAARWINMHTNYEWVAMSGFDNMKTCISCERSLPKGATTCPTPGCGDLIEKGLRGYWTMQEMRDKDPILADRVKVIQQRERDRERKAAARGGEEIEDES